MSVLESTDIAPISGFSDFCAVAALEAGEPIYGTAADATTVWLILEYPYAWGNKALSESALSPAVKEKLNEWVSGISGARVQLIKQQPAGASAPEVVHELSGQTIQFFVGISEESSSIYRFELNTYDELLPLDVPSLVEHARRADETGERDDSQTHIYANNLYQEPLYLVCTNGKRDRCCAKWGLPYYYAMREVAGDAAWQTTHTGGHRFAATMICFPQGLFYGWLAPEDAAPLVAAHERGELYRLDRYRGRATYPRVVQAADCYLREQAEETRIDAWHFSDMSIESTSQDDRWTVSFQTEEGAVHALQLRQFATPKPFLQSCAKEPAPAVYFAPETT